MYCPKCGAECDGAQQFCSKCGYNLNPQKGADDGSYDINSQQTSKSKPTQKSPDNYLVWAILATLFCCLPTGIVSIIYSTKVEQEYMRGDYQAACNASNKAKKWAIWSAILAAIFLVLYFVFMIIMFSVGMSLDSFI